jgi:hypothetical protein
MTVAFAAPDVSVQRAAHSDTTGNSGFDTPRTEWHDAAGRVSSVLERHSTGTYATRYRYDVLCNRIAVGVSYWVLD